MTKIGRQNLLKRRGLLIQNSPRRGFSRLQFASIPRLLQWAERKERGEQALRHKVRLPREALDKLIFTASRKEFEPRVLDAWRAGVKRGFS
jgi:hypothetical protein